MDLPACIEPSSASARPELLRASTASRSRTHAGAPSRGPSEADVDDGAAGCLEELLQNFFGDAVGQTCHEQLRFLIPHAKTMDLPFHPSTSIASSDESSGATARGRQYLLGVGESAGFGARDEQLPRRPRRLPALSTQARPPWLSAMCLTSARPMPLPRTGAAGARSRRALRGRSARRCARAPRAGRPGPGRSRARRSAVRSSRPRGR